MPEDASGDGTESRDGRDAGSEPTPELGDDRDADSEPTPEWRDNRDQGHDADSEPTPGWGPDQAGDTQAERERIPLDLSSRESDSDREEPDTAADTDEYVPEPSSAPIEAGDPDLEHAIFVLLGAVAMLLVIARLVALPLG